MDPNQQMSTGRLPVVRRPDGTLRFAEFADELKRPFRLAFYTEVNGTVDPAIERFASEIIMPAVVSLIPRFIRVRAQLQPAALQSVVTLYSWRLGT